MNASMRRWFYLIAGLAAAAVPILMQLGVVEPGQGDAWVAMLGSMAGGGAALTAAHKTHQQVKAGVHDPPLDPVDTVQQAMDQILQQQVQANANVDKLRQATGDLLVGATQSIPIVGDVVGVGNDVVQSTLDDILGVQR